MKRMNQWCVELGLLGVLAMGYTSINSHANVESDTQATLAQNRCIMAVGQLRSQVDSTILLNQARHLVNYLNHIFRLDRRPPTNNTIINWPTNIYPTSSQANDNNLAYALANYDIARNVSTPANYLNIASLIDIILNANQASSYLSQLTRYLNNPRSINRTQKRQIMNDFDLIISTIFANNGQNQQAYLNPDICINNNFNLLASGFSCSENPTELNLANTNNETSIINAIAASLLSWENPGPFISRIGQVEMPLGIISRIPEYTTNPQAQYCMRNPNVADTIIIHHTASRNDTTPSQINSSHLARSTNNDQWLMIGYNFLIPGDYVSSMGANPRSALRHPIPIITGRPLSMRGAHAGGPERNISQNTRDILSQETMYCYGSGTNNPTSQNLSEQINDQGEISANITTIGVAIVGNYASKFCNGQNGNRYICNVGGYTSTPRYPSTATLRRTAQLICSLQKSYPRLRTIKPHSFFRVDPTACPGRVHDTFDLIINYAQEYGCTFSK